MNFICDYLISFFYIGYIKFAPGTVASLFSLLIFYFIPNIFFLQFIVLILILIIGFLLCYRYYLKNTIKDPQHIVIDEVVGMFISLFMLPKTIVFYTLAFILFRFFDIYKPSIIRKSENIGFGFGIMIDDIISGAITLLLIRGISLCL